MSRRRGFSLIEVIATTAIAASVAATAIAISSRTSDGFGDAQDRMAVLEAIQRERNAHVNRGMETEVLLWCPAVAGGGCTDSGKELVAYRVTLPAAFPPNPARELARFRFDSTLSFETPGSIKALVVDAFARSVDANGDPVNTVLRLRQRSSTATVLFRREGSVVPSFDAPGALVVAPKIVDVGTRATPNPTPQAEPSEVPRARQVALE
jgi:prepilin-type N-terminal cleavage/methylation domain-containing protein